MENDLVCWNIYFKTTEGSVHQMDIRLPNFHRNIIEPMIESITFYTQHWTGRGIQRVFFPPHHVTRYIISGPDEYWNNISSVKELLNKKGE